MLPGPAAVGRSVDSVSNGEIGALQSLAAAHVNDLGIRRGDRERADRLRRLSVEDRHPDAAVVGAFPHAAVIGGDIEDVRLFRHPGCCDGAAAAEWSNHAPANAGIELGTELLSTGQPRQQSGNHQDEHEQKKTSRCAHRTLGKTVW